MFSSSRWLPSRRVQGVDRRRTGPDRRRADLGSASRAVHVPTQPSLVRRMSTACRRRRPARPRPPPNDRPAQTDRTDVRDQITGLVLPESDPVAVSIPRIGVRSTLVDLGLDADGAMEVPQDPALAGWFSRGAAPGALGPAVIAGHVTWDGAPAVFHRLGTLRRGDQVAVTRKDGKTAVFTVSRVARFSKSRFPSSGGLRRNRPCRTATDHLRWHLRRRQTPVPGQRRRLRQAGVGARASRLTGQRRSALDHQHEGFGLHAGVGVQHPKPVTTRLPELDIGGEPARLVGLRGYREGQPRAFLPALHPQKGVGSTAVRPLIRTVWKGLADRRNPPTGWSCPPANRSRSRRRNLVSRSSVGGRRVGAGDGPALDGRSAGDRLCVIGAGNARRSGLADQPGRRGGDPDHQGRRQTQNAETAFLAPSWCVGGRTWAGACWSPVLPARQHAVAVRNRRVHGNCRMTTGITGPHRWHARQGLASRRAQRHVGQPAEERRGGRPSRGIVIQGGQQYLHQGPS